MGQGPDAASEEPIQVEPQEMTSMLISVIDDYLRDDISMQEVFNEDAG